MMRGASGRIRVPQPSASRSALAAGNCKSQLAPRINGLGLAGCTQLENLLREDTECIGLPYRLGQRGERLHFPDGIRREWVERMRREEEAGVGRTREGEAVAKNRKNSCVQERRPRFLKLS